MKSYTVVDPRGDDEARLEQFKENLHHELQPVAHVKLPALDLMFFPMITSEHSYVICFNIKNQRIDVIDNSSKVVSSDQKYGKVPSDFKYMVMEYLKSESLEAKSNRFKSVKPTRIKITWRDNENKEDCEGNRSQLDRLRVKYAAAILSAQINELRDKNKDKAMKFFKKE
nr:putative ulp1 protease family, C-terminal catalytic domain-containing protein [Ipomoea batatas]